MKKRIFSLMLAIVMLLSLALVSCKGDEDDSSDNTPTTVTPTGDVVPTEKLLGKFEVEQQDPDTVKLSDKVIFAGNEYSSLSISYPLSNYCKAFQKDIKDSTNDEVVSYEYSYYIIETGKVIKQVVPKLNGDETVDQLKTLITNFTFNTANILGTRVFYASLTYGTGEDAKTNITVYDENATELLKVEDSETVSLYVSSEYSSSSEGVKGFFIVEDILYRLDENEETEAVTVAKLVDLKENSAPRGYLSSLKYDKTADEYYYITDNAINVFDKNLTLKNIIVYESVNNSSPTVTTLENGSKYIRETYSVPDDATDYTYQKNGTKYIVKTSIFSAEKGIVAVDSIGYTGTIKTLKSLGWTTKDETIKNVITNASKIEADKTLVSTNDVIVIDNDGKVVKVLENELDLGEQIVKYPNGAIKVKNNFESYIIDANGNKLATLPTFIEGTNNKWFVTEKYVFDASMNAIYTIPENREIHKIMPDSIVFTEEYQDDAQNTITKYILWTGANTEKVISETSNSSDIRFCSEFYYTKVDNSNGTRNYVFYNSDGTELLSIVNVSTLSVNDSYINYTVYNTELSYYSNVFISIID